MHELLTLFSKSRLDPDYGVSFYHSIPDGFTFTRSTGNATYFDANGVMQYAGVNEPRFNHYPVSGEARCLMIESQVTNKVPYSLVTYTGWYSNSITLSGAISAPDGTPTFRRMHDGIGTGRHYLVANNISYTSGETTTYSFYAKKHTANMIQLSVPSGAFGGLYINFDLSTGSITKESGMTGEIKHIGNGVYHCIGHATAVHTKTSDTSFVVALINDDPNAHRFPTYVGTNKGVYIWGCQNEVSKIATSYIPTNGSAVTRATDILKKTNLPWWNATAGTVVIVGDITGRTGVSQQLFNAQHSLTDTYTLAPSHYGTGYGKVVSGGVMQKQFYFPEASADTLMRMGMSYKTGEVSVVIDGIHDSTATGINLPVGVDTLYLGCSSWGAQLNGHLRSFKYWRTALSDEDLKRITK